jgi:hypothetical protein
MDRATPSGITPPAPGLEHEEPEFATEDDIPSDDGGPAASERQERGTGATREPREHHKPERE